MLRTRNITAVALLAAPAWAQSFNIDINPGGLPFGDGLPAASFAGAAENTGYWNEVANVPGLTQTLRGLNGAMTTVTLQTSGIVINHSANDAATGDYSKLMEDGWKIAGASDTISCTIAGLEPGPYYLYTYADSPDSSSQLSRVTVGGDFQNIGGIHGTNEFVSVVTHARHLVQVGAGGSIAVQISNNPNVASSRGFLAGLQLQKLPSRLYANENAPAGGDGLTWASAFPSLQDAIDRANELAGALDEIWVAGGVYVPTTGTWRGETFWLPDGVKMYGGFAGNETNIDQRTESHPSYLSGHIGPGGIEDNVYHVVTAWNCGSETQLDGFVIHSGNANGTLGNDGTGGGMLIRDAQSMRVTNCRFLTNLATDGAAVFVQDSSPRFEDCLFSGNTAAESGGAVQTGSGGSAKFIRCTFSHNSATNNDGGAIDHDGATLIATNCVFHGNYGRNWGGAISAEGSSAQLANCLITDNETWAATGAGVMVWGDGNSMIVSNSTICRNSGRTNGGASAIQNATLVVRNSILVGNLAHNGGSTDEVEQLHASTGGQIQVNYCDVQGWTGSLGGAGNFWEIPQFVDADGADGVPGTGDDNWRLLPNSPCIDRGSNSQLPADSGDLDSDNNLIELLPLDMDMNARRTDDPATTDQGQGTAPIVDIGAYEFEPECDLAGDLDADGDVDLQDLAVLLGHFGTTSGAGGEDGDSDADGDVDLQDLATLLGNFGTACP